MYFQIGGNLFDIFWSRNLTLIVSQQINDRSVSMQLAKHLHRVLEKKRPQYSRHNFDKFKHSFVIFGTNDPDTSVYCQKI